MFHGKEPLKQLLLTGPRWYFNDGAIRNMFLYFGPAIDYEDADLFTDYEGVLDLTCSLEMAGDTK